MQNPDELHHQRIFKSMVSQSSHHNDPTADPHAPPSARDPLARRGDARSVETADSYAGGVSDSGGVLHSGGVPTPTDDLSEIIFAGSAYCDQFGWPPLSYSICPDVEPRGGILKPAVVEEVVDGYFNTLAGFLLSKQGKHLASSHDLSLKAQRIRSAERALRADDLDRLKEFERAVVDHYRASLHASRTENGEGEFGDSVRSSHPLHLELCCPRVLVAEGTGRRHYAFLAVLLDDVAAPRRSGFVMRGRFFDGDRGLNAMVVLTADLDPSKLEHEPLTPTSWGWEPVFSRSAFEHAALASKAALAAHHQAAGCVDSNALLQYIPLADRQGSSETFVEETPSGCSPMLADPFVSSLAYELGRVLDWTQRGNTPLVDPGELLRGESSLFASVDYLSSLDELCPSVGDAENKCSADLLDAGIRRGEGPGKAGVSLSGRDEQLLDRLLDDGSKRSGGIFIPQSKGGLPTGVTDPSLADLHGCAPFAVGNAGHLFGVSAHLRRWGGESCCAEIYTAVARLHPQKRTVEILPFRKV